MDKNNTPKLQEAMSAYLKGSYETAFNMFCELAFDNNGRAMYFLGKFYEVIPGVNIVKQRYELRDTWYKLGASRGDALATLAYIRAKLKLTAKNGISIKVFNNCFETVRTKAIEGDAFAKMEMYYTYSDASIYEDYYNKYLNEDYKNFCHFFRVIIGKVQVKGDTAAQTFVGFQKIFHGLRVTGEDYDYVIPMVFHFLYNRIDGFRAIMVIAVQCIGFVNK